MTKNVSLKIWTYNIDCKVFIPKIPEDEETYKNISIKKKSSTEKYYEKGRLYKLDGNEYCKFESEKAHMVAPGQLWSSNSIYDTNLSIHC